MFKKKKKVCINQENTRNNFKASTVKADFKSATFERCTKFGDCIIIIILFQNKRKLLKTVPTDLSKQGKAKLSEDKPDPTTCI